MKYVINKFFIPKVGKRTKSPSVQQWVNHTVSITPKRSNKNFCFLQPIRFKQIEHIFIFVDVHIKSHDGINNLTK